MDTEKAHESELDESKNTEQSRPKKIAAIIDKIKKILPKKKQGSKVQSSSDGASGEHGDKNSSMGLIPLLVLLMAVGFIVFGIYSLIDIFAEKYRHQKNDTVSAKSESHEVGGHATHGTHGDALSKFASEQKNITIAKEKLVPLSLYTVFVQANSGRRSVNVELYLEASDGHTAKVLNAHRDALEDVVNSFLTTLHEDDFSDPIRREEIKSKLIAYVDKNLLEKMRAQKKFGPKLGQAALHDSSHDKSAEGVEHEDVPEEVKGKIETVYFTQLVMG